ncbi:conserved hypothetical protein [Xanthomonas citri pv. citri]|nr:conserved hypothetical protein [Xanthomonas citri pv. citri]CEH82185.1 conserved hypothetical protein [Xanthomonas citri pv. citri]
MVAANQLSTTCVCMPNRRQRSRKEHERPADGLAELTQDAIDLIINQRVRWFRPSCFWRATASSAARGLETLLATHCVIATRTCGDVRDTDVG